MENTVNNINVDEVIENLKNDTTADETQTQNDGSVNIADEVVTVISSMAVKDVEGVVGMVGSVAGGFAELLGKKNPSKGVRTVREGDAVTVFLSVIVEYGAKIPDVAWNLQTKVKNDIEAMTGLEVKAVNVAVDSIALVEENKTVEDAREAVKDTVAKEENSESENE